MRKFAIISLYILIFWFIIPALLIMASVRLDVILNFNHSPFLIAGILVLVISVPSLVIYIIQFSTFSGELPVSAYPPKNILQRGIYNYLRHPVYLFYTLTFIGTGLLLGSYALLIIVLPLFMIFTYGYILIEEHELTKRFGNAYTYYKKRTGLIIPSYYQLNRYPLLLLFKYLFHFKTKKTKGFHVSPPYFVIAEHKNYLDPFFIGVSFPHRVSYLTTFEMYRTPFMIRMMGILGNIPRKRFKADYTSNKLLIEAIEQGAVLCLFPEGERSWTGDTQHFKPEVLKFLLKKNDIPIVLVKITGNYPAWPRWSTGYKRYKIAVEIREPFYPDTASSNEELEREILHRIGSSVKPEKITGNSTDSVSGLEKVFYRCSECGEYNSFSVDKYLLTCQQCGFALTVSSDLQISYKKSGSTRLMTIDEYYRTIKVNPDDPVFEKPEYDIDNEEVLIDLKESGECELSGEKGRSFQPVLKGNIFITDKSIICKNSHVQYSFRYQDISSVTTESNDKLQLFILPDRQLYQLKFQKSSVLQWQDIITSAIAHKLNKEVNMR
jgi:1-acyl-sn-glycerol-3-phosphate acyltransferase